MKKILLTSAVSLLFFSINVFAAGNPHIAEALKHATAAASAGDNAKIIEHALPAQEHAMAAALTTKGVAKSHTNEAVKSLEQAVDAAKNKKTDAASAAAKAAVDHLNAAKSSK